MADSSLQSALAASSISMPTKCSASDHDAPAAMTGMPSEVLLHMLLFTTPTSFMAFSQTCRRFRSLTMPDRHHFMLRLIELELTTEYGGRLPIIDRFGIVNPSLYDEAGWQNLRYACSGCLKLRSHRAFDNTAILSLPMRKPEHHMPAARLPAEPGNRREREIRRIRAEGTRRDRLRNEKRLRHAIERHRGIIGPWSVHVPGRNAPLEHIKEYEDLMYRTAGQQRHKRLCADCKLSKRRYPGFAGAYMVSDPAAALPNAFHTLQPDRAYEYYLAVPVIRTRWYTDFAPAAQSLIKEHVKSMGHQAAKCRVCGRWRALLGFVRDSPRKFFSITVVTAGLLLAAHRSVCWECRHGDQIERGEVVEKT